ncbi:MAG TPA: polysaccharide deacetylase family protein [Solirubrobacteraceae bacterium]|nr:polysaccharide deacetylase family protein [Solirubrobacteraceae bacterium]
MSGEIALTFDDGPCAVTGALLDVLGRHGARATFFCVGSLIAGHEAELARAAGEGHELGVHGWVHEDHRDDPRRRASEAVRTADALAAATGTRPRLFRPPFGSTSPELEAAMSARGLRTVLWDVDPRDWEDPGVEAIRSRTLAELTPGAVVLLHERPDTVHAVELILGDGWRSVLMP